MRELNAVARNLERGGECRKKGESARNREWWGTGCDKGDQRGGGGGEGWGKWCSGQTWHSARSG